MSNLTIGITTIYILAQLALGAVFAHQSRKYRRNARLLFLGLVFGILASILALILQFDSPFLGKRILLPAELILYSLEYILLNLHFQFSSNSRLNLAFNFPLMVSWTIFFVMSIKFGFNLMDDFDELLWDLSYNFVGLYSFVYIAFSLYRSADFSGEIEALFQAFGAIALSVGFFFGAISTPMLREILSVEILISEVTKAIGALIFISIYAMNVDFVERMAINTYGLLLFDDTGRSLGFYPIRTRKRDLNKSSPIVPDLIAPFVTAIQAFARDIFGAEESLETIQAKGKSLIFQIGNKIHMAIITEKATRNLKISLKKFQEDCERMAFSRDEHDIKTFDPESIKKIVKFNFPYVQVLETRLNEISDFD